MNSKSMNYSPRLLYFGSSDAARTPIACYAAQYYAALSDSERVSAQRVLHLRTAENLEGYDSAVSLVRKHTTRVLREESRQLGGMSRFPQHIIHGEIGRVTYREFWGVYFAARLRPEVPVVLVFHDPPVLTPPVRSAAIRQKSGFFFRLIRNFTSSLAAVGQSRVEGYFISRASAMLAHTRMGVKLLAERYPAHLHKIGLAPSTIMGEIPLEAPIHKRSPKEVVRITCFGFVRHDRALDELVDAICLVHKRYPLIGKAALRIRGRIPNDVLGSGFARNIQERIKKLGIAWLVDFKPGALAEDDVNRLLSDTDILVLPHREGAANNGVSRTLLRAGCWGVALVASDVGSMREQARDGKEAILYPAGDIQKLAEILKNLIRNCDQRVELARALRERVLREHGSRNVVSKMVELYGEMLEARDENRPVVFPSGMKVFDLPREPETKELRALTESETAGEEENA